VDKPIRAAFFADSYLEVNGAAMTSQRLVGYARDNDYPYLCIHGGRENLSYKDGSVGYLRLKRSPVSIKLDEDLAYDPLFQRHTNRVLRALAEFKPDVLHITGVNDVSIVGAYLAWKLHLPLVGSWHTNVHEFAARRLTRLFGFLPDASLSKFTNFTERKIMDGAVLYYKMPQVVLAPNQELIDALGKGTGRTSVLMSRGVDTEMFAPAKRTANDAVFRMGFVGRLRAEKNVRLLVDLEQELIKAGRTNFEFLIVGEGNEREYLEKNLKHANFTGFLDGEGLSEAYANMDVFVFPSETDAFGNVTQEAFASGVPAIVTNQGGPKFVVKHGETGFIAENLADFTKFTIELMDDPAKLNTLKLRAREFSMSRSWEAVFKGVFDAYRQALDIRQKSEASKVEQ
jgi:glycosyltransferase involved in cell wall biosynthesis